MPSTAVGAITRVRQCDFQSWWKHWLLCVCSIASRPPLLAPSGTSLANTHHSIFAEVTGATLAEVTGATFAEVSGAIG